MVSITSGCRGDKTEDPEPNPKDSQSSLGTEAYYNRILAREPDNHQAHFGRAKRYTEIGHFDKAMADLEEAIRLAPDSFNYVKALAGIHLDAVDPNLQLPDSKKAIELLKSFTDTHPDDETAMIELANVYLYVKQYDQLHAEMDRLLKSNRLSADAWFFKGIAYSFAGDTAQAVKCMQASLEIDPTAADVHYETGLLLDRSNPKLAITYYGNAFRFDSTHTDAYYMKGFTYQRMGRYENAMTIYRDLVRRDRQFSKAHYNMGYIWFEQDSVSQAFNAFDRAIAVEPGYADAYYMRGLMSERLGDLEKSKRDYRQTLNLDPRHRLAADGLDRLKDTE
jgi:tetratricopeptide (TPR) repeat protein